MKTWGGFLHSHQQYSVMSLPSGCTFQFVPIKSLAYNHTVYYRSDNWFSIYKVVMCCVNPYLISHLNHQLGIVFHDKILSIFILSIYIHIFCYQHKVYLWSYYFQENKSDTCSFNPVIQIFVKLYSTSMQKQDKCLVAYINVAHHVYSWIILTLNILFCSWALS